MFLWPLVSAHLRSHNGPKIWVHCYCKLHFGKQEEVTGSQIQQVGRVGCEDCIVIGRELSHFHWAVRRLIIKFNGQRATVSGHLHQIFSLRCLRTIQ